MPDEDVSEEQVAEIVRSIEAGEDGIVVPKELVDEPEQAQRRALPQSLYAQVLVMRIPEKIKLALRGNHDARVILIRDNVKMIRRFVLLNPRISDGEVISLARNKSADEELLRVITERREWMRNYQVRLGLATNPKTPLPVALRQVATLDERDMRQIAKSKNVPGAIAAQARRILLTKQPSR
jgi:hypothetical protein